MLNDKTKLFDCYRKKLSNADMLTIKLVVNENCRLDCEVWVQSTVDVYGRYKVFA